MKILRRGGSGMRRQGVTIMTFRLFISVNSSPSSLPHSEYRSKMELPSFPVYIFSVQPVTIACVLTSPGTSFLPMLRDNACSLFYSWIMYHHISEGLQKLLQSRSTRPIVVIYGKQTNKQTKPIIIIQKIHLSRSCHLFGQGSHFPDSLSSG